MIQNPDEKRILELVAEIQCCPEENWDEELDRREVSQTERESVLALLNAKILHFLDAPSQVLAEVSDSLDLEAGASGASSSPSFEESLERAIGPYEVIETLGEGGMGTVYRARDTGDLRREVALKLVKAGMDTREILNRFEVERNVLAAMSHEGIARVLDAGSTQLGRPYFVMEYVDGEPITEYCDNNKLGTTERLDLFRRVCAAAHHAHRRGVLHRDLKPSNILVTEVDGAPAPKVIDFGIAKAMNQKLSAETVQTQTFGILGTPEYMSPDQLSLPGDLDVRADVYSLGVVLFELLTGELPFSSDALRKSGEASVRDVILNKTPPRPSSKNSQIPRELDWVVLRALEKERDRRYESALELAQDIERYRRKEVLIAGPPSQIYQARKFVQRNAAAVLSGTMVVAALVFGLGFYIEQLRANQDLLEEVVGGVLGDAREGGWEERLARLDDVRSRIGEGTLSPGLERDLSLREFGLALACHDRARTEAALQEYTNRALSQPERDRAALWAFDLSIWDWPHSGVLTDQLADLSDLKLERAESSYLRGLKADTLQEAITHFEVAISGAPTDARVHVTTASALLFAGRHDDLANRLASARVSFPKLPELAMLEAISQQLQGTKVIEEEFAARLTDAGADESYRECALFLLKEIDRVFGSAKATIKQGYTEGFYPDGFPITLTKESLKSAQEFVRLCDSRQIKPGEVLPIHPRVLMTYPSLGSVGPLFRMQRHAEVDNTWTEAFEVSQDGLFAYCIASHLAFSGPGRALTILTDTMDSPATWVEVQRHAPYLGIRVADGHRRAAGKRPEFQSRVISFVEALALRAHNRLPIKKSVLQQVFDASVHAVRIMTEENQDRLFSAMGVILHRLEELGARGHQKRLRRMNYEHFRSTRDDRGASGLHAVRGMIEGANEKNADYGRRFFRKFVYPQLRSTMDEAEELKARVDALEAEKQGDSKPPK